MATIAQSAGLDPTLVIFAFIVLPIICIAIGFLMGNFRVPKFARGLGKAVKKGMPILFLSGHDRNLRAVPMTSGLTSYWHQRDLETIPDEKGTFGFYGTIAAFASSQSVSNINPEFLTVLEAFRSQQTAPAKDGKKPGLSGMEDVLGREIGGTPEELSRCIYMLEDRKNAVEARMELVRKINSGATTIEEESKKLRLNELAAQRFRIEIQGEIDDLNKNAGGKAEQSALGREHEKIMAARKITVDQDGWAILEIPPKDPTQKRTFKLIRRTLHTLDDFFMFMPTGSNMNSIYTMVKRNTIADRMENRFDEAKGFRWFIIGTVAMMIMIGAGVMVYLSTKG